MSKKLNYAALEGLFDTTPGGEAAQTQREDTADLDYYGTVARKQKAQQHRSESPTAALNGRQHEGGEEEDQQQEEEEEDGVVDVEYDPTAHIADTSQQQPDQEEEPEEEEEEEEEEEPAYDDEK